LDTNRRIPGKEFKMKFFLVEGNLGRNATREQTDRLITMLRDKGWDVEYGAKSNVADDISEFGQEERLQDAFSDDFMACIDLIESEGQ